MHSPDQNETKQNTEHAENDVWAGGKETQAKRIFSPLLQIFDDKMTIACT